MREWTGERYYHLISWWPARKILKETESGFHYIFTTSSPLHSINDFYKIYEESHLSEDKEELEFIKRVFTGNKEENVFNVESIDKAESYFDESAVPVCGCG